MILFRNYEDKYSKAVYDLFMEVRAEDDFFKEFSYEVFVAIYLKVALFKMKVVLLR